jgi:hypothetical protein
MGADHTLQLPPQNLPEGRRVIARLRSWTGVPELKSDPRRAPKVKAGGCRRYLPAITSSMDSTALPTFFYQQPPLAMERGIKLPNLLTILRLALALDCKVVKLVKVFDETSLAAILAE